MKRLNKIFKLLSLVFIAIFLLTLTACNDNKAKTGYKLWQDIMLDTYTTDEVEFNYADFVKVENGDSDVYYYMCKFTIYVGNTDAEDVAYIRWFEGTSQVFESSEDVYELAYDSINNNEMEGLLGRVR